MALRDFQDLKGMGELFRRDPLAAVFGQVIRRVDEISQHAYDLGVIADVGVLLIPRVAELQATREPANGLCDTQQFGECPPEERFQFTSDTRRALSGG